MFSPLHGQTLPLPAGARPGEPLRQLQFDAQLH